MHCASATIPGISQAKAGGGSLLEPAASSAAATLSSSGSPNGRPIRSIPIGSRASCGPVHPNRPLAFRSQQTSTLNPGAKRCALPVSLTSPATLTASYTVSVKPIGTEMTCDERDRLSQGAQGEKKGELEISTRSS
eukprot:COSAG04_NODE_3018_length_3274_cov_2.658268_3_plen_136_part_00